MATLGFSRDNPFRLSGGQYTPAQREQIERKYISNAYAANMPDGTGWKWEWVETRTFPDTGRTYDIVGAMIGFPDAAHNEIWFDVTNTLAPAEKGPIDTRAATVPTVKPSAAALRPAGQADSTSSGLIPTLLILGTLAGFTALEYFFRPDQKPSPPVRRRRRKSVMLPV